MWDRTFLMLLMTMAGLEGTILFRRQSKKCEAVVMCPQFCLKIKDGCYACECGASMNTFMEGAIQQMKHDYDPIYQTGSKFVNVNMETNGAMSGQRTDTRKSPWLNMGMGVGTFGGLMMGGTPAVSQAGHYLEPDFKEFYKPVGQTLPGRCPEMDYACPGQCWKTDGFSGCLRCDCGGSTPQPTSLRTTTPGSTHTEPGSTHTELGPTTVDITTHPPTTAIMTSTVSSSQITTSQKMTSGIHKMTSESVIGNKINLDVAENKDKNGTFVELKPDVYPSGQLHINSHGTTGVGAGDGILIQSGSWSKSKTGNGTGSIGTGRNGTGPMGTTFTVSQSVALESLTNLNGADLFKILIAGIKEHKSLEQVLNSLAHKVDQGQQTAQSHMDFAAQTQSGNSTGSSINTTANEHKAGQKDVATFETLKVTPSPLVTHSTVLPEHTETRPYDITTTSPKLPSKSTPAPGITKILGFNEILSMNGNSEKDKSNDCLDIGSACPLKCHVIDPVSHCPVCGCPDKNDLNHRNSKCIALDTRCPSDCITLDTDMCPVCACSHTQVGNDTDSSPVVTQLPTNQTVTDTICKITEKIRSCVSSCLTFDDHFCPQCACSADSAANDIEKDLQPSLDADNICPAIERGCPQRCLRFDERFCAYCFCDN